MTVKVREQSQLKLLKITTVTKLVFFIQADTLQEQLIYYE